MSYINCHILTYLFSVTKIDTTQIAKMRLCTSDTIFRY